MNCKKYPISLLSLALLIFPLTVNSLTVHDAMILAHENNYKVLSEHQNYQAAKMSKPQAISGLLPNASVSHTNYHNTYKDPTTKALYGSPYYRQYSLNLSQPLFNGGATYAQIKIANKSIQSSLSRFNDVSNMISASAVQAYESVLSSREIYDINIKNTEVFQKNLEFTKIRFDVGVVTRTDVLQTEVRLSEAIAQKERAYAEMMNAEANFEHIVGIRPSKLLENIDLNTITVPASIDELIEIAKNSNPALSAAKSDSKAAQYQVNVAVSQILPVVSANAQFSKTTEAKFTGATGISNGNTYTLQVQVPLFQGGGEYATIKQKKHLANKAKLDSKEVERQLIESCITVWNNYKTVKSVILARLNAIKAASQALEGVKEEVNVGTRTTLDLLNAEKELFDAKVSHRQAKYDLVMSIHQMLQVMGHLNIPTEDDTNKVK